MRRLFLILSVFLFTHFGSLAQDIVQIPDTVQISEQSMKDVEKFVSAVNHRVSGKYKLAIPILQDLIKNQSADPAVHYELARCLYLDKQFEPALLQVAKSISFDPSNRWYKIFEVEILETTGNFTTAAEKLEIIVAEFPKEEDYWYKLSNMYTQSSLLKKSIDVFDRMQQVFGVKEEYLFRKFQLQVENNDTNGALATLELMNNNFPNNIALKNSLASFYKNMGRHTDANRLYQEVLLLDPNDSKANLALASEKKDLTSEDNYLLSIQHILSNKTLNIDDKIGELVPFIEKFIDNQDANLADPLVKSAESLIEAHPSDPKAFSIAGDIYFHAGSYEQSLKMYNKALTLTKRVYTIYDQKMLILLYQKKYQELVDFSNEVLDIYPNQMTPYIHLAYGLLKLGNPNEALTQLRTPETMANKNSTILPQILTLSAIAQWALNDKNKAETTILKADALVNSPSSARQMSGLLLEFNIFPELAKKKLDWAYSKDPNECFTNYFLALYAFKSNDHLKALEFILSSISKGGEKFPMITETAGDIYFMNKDLNKAVLYWEKTKNMGVQSSILDKKISTKSFIQ